MFVEPLLELIQASFEQTAPVGGGNQTILQPGPSWLPSGQLLTSGSPEPWAGPRSLHSRRCKEAMYNLPQRLLK